MAWAQTIGLRDGLGCRSGLGYGGIANLIDFHRSVGRLFAKMPIYISICCTKNIAVIYLFLFKSCSIWVAVSSKVKTEYL